MLPWSQKLNIDYRKPLPLLEKLHSDNSRYVTRSVANHLNDISKLDPDRVIETLRRWQQADKQDKKELAYIVRHSLRTLIKKGHPGALKLLGFGDAPDITISRFETATPTITIGESLVFEFVFLANKNQNLMIDYLMIFPVNENKTTEKVFKLKQCTVTAGQTLSLKKKHPFRLMTTRRLYPGVHTLKLQINGKPLTELSFELIVN